jgi:hypothetical protein
MIEVEQRFQQRGRDVNTLVTKLSTMMMSSAEQTEDWKEKAFEKLQGVVEQLNETIKTADLIDEANAAINSEETRKFFDERTNRFGIIYDEEFDTQEERDNLEEASSIVRELFECVKGMVQDTWIIQKEEEERAKQASFNRSRMAFGPISEEGSRTNPTELGSQGTGSGVRMYENGNIHGPFTHHQGVDPRMGQGIHTPEPIINIQSSKEQQMMLLMMNHMQQEAERSTGLMKHMQQHDVRSAQRDELTVQIAQRKEDRESKQEDQKMNFANQAAKLPQFMRPPPAKAWFGGKSITEVTTAELRKYFERIASFVETVDQEAGPLNKLIKTDSMRGAQVDKPDMLNLRQNTLSASFILLWDRIYR